MYWWYSCLRGLLCEIMLRSIHHGRSADARIVSPSDKDSEIVSEISQGNSCPRAEKRLYAHENRPDILVA